MAELRELAGKLTAEERAKLVGGNAAAAYGL